MSRPFIADSGATSIWIVIMRIPRTTLHIYTPKKKREKEAQRQKEWDEVLKPSSSRPPVTEQRPRQVKPPQGKLEKSEAQRRSPDLPPEVMNQIVGYLGQDAAAGDAGAAKGINNVRQSNKAFHKAWNVEANIGLVPEALRRAAYKPFADPKRPLLSVLKALVTLPPKDLEQAFNGTADIELRLGLHWQNTKDSSDPMAVALRQTVAALPPERGAEILRIGSKNATGQRLLDFIGDEHTPGTIASLPAKHRAHALTDLVEASRRMLGVENRQAVVQAVDALPQGTGDDLKAKVSRT
jgi:hypothetical protein